MADFTDDFNRANGNLVSPWTTVVGVGLGITSNQLHKGSPAGGEAHAISALIGEGFTDDQFCDLTLVNLNDSFDAPGVGIRFNSGGTGYVMRYIPSDVTVQFLEFTSGTPTNLGTNAITIDAGSQIRMIGTGSTIQAFVLPVVGDPILSIEIMSSSITSGEPAVYYSNGDNNTNFCDDFEATSFGVPAGGGQQGVHDDTIGLSTDGVHI